MNDVKVFNKPQASICKHRIYSDSRVEAVFNCIPVSLESRLMLHTVVFCFFFKVCILFIYLFIYLFMAMLGLRFCARAFSSCGKRGPLFIAVRGPLTIVASLVGSTGSRRAGSVIVAHGPSCSAACGILPEQGLNPCPLHWQADSQPLRHQGSPVVFFNICLIIRKSFVLGVSKTTRGM